MVAKHSHRGDTRIPATPARWTAAPDPNWMPVAIRLYEGAIRAPQARFYTDTDYAQLWFYCSELSALMLDPRPSAERLKSLHQLGADLLLTESARRRARIEIQPAKENER